MRILLTITFLTVVGFAASGAKTPESLVVRKTPTMREPQTKTSKLTGVQAIELAENFIAQNGYTDLPPDKARISYESIEWESNLDELLKERYNTLERKAFGISRGSRCGSSGWTVVFKYKNPSDVNTRKIGRAVTMGRDGSKARVEHKDFILAKVGKKL